MGSLPLALYVHWPYCARICPYCDFNVTRHRGQASQRGLFDALLADLRRQAQGLGERQLASLFFGGGTPSLLPPEWVAELIAAAHTLFPTAGNIEITLEANPTDAEIARYQGFRSAGVNRLSLGVQSLDDQALTFLGRDHSAREAMHGIETAQSVFGRVSLDLIYALPDQDVDAWEAELRQAAALGVEHISPYQLTIEQATAFGRAVRRGQWSPPGQDLAEAFYFCTQDVLGQLGFEAYEVSNHARGPVARSAHNVLIWEGVDYMGIGPGSHGRLTRNGVRHATIAEPDLKTYAASADPIAVTALSLVEAEEEALMLGLRLIEGVRLERLPSLDLAKADTLIAEGFLACTKDRLRATDKGRVVLDRLLLELLS
ncbi:radical SAM family heme chaperone HemW [Asticcacaulis sp. EMRT-3]|uniref:radical SAM family heme chaperone HemW n=1 Tax=Asticcacaulis sp. EMRT-3 TaxID=3040349 RepID=UPI0024AFF809|nr:radical SAM family heme chaperone HemW [Asticcacaulis sp. EMRT-3]MDI7775986.1 radical SAM family heme chaperone HemW [Asticcacaulis sp. EMRT-3]